MRTLDSPRTFVLACTSEAFDALVPEECLASANARVVTLAPLGIEAPDHLNEQREHW
ncbi:hypothetical protein ACFV4N_28200 [Actinosynnema sp. NPDC059797]